MVSVAVPIAAIDDQRFAEPGDGLGTRFSPWVSFGLFSGNVRQGSATLFTTDLGARFTMSPEARASVDWGFGYAAAHVVGNFVTVDGMVPYDRRTDRVEARNADFSIEWVPRVGSVRFSLGIGLAIPMAATANPAVNVDQAAQLDASRTAHDVMLGMHGALDPWRYRPERLGVFVPISLAIDASPVTIVFEGAGALSVTVLGATGPVTGDAQIAATLFGDATPELRIGGRIGLSILGIGAASTNAQPSIEPFVRWTVRPMFFQLSGVVAIAGPYGIGSEISAWSSSLAVGALVD